MEGVWGPSLRCTQDPREEVTWGMGWGLGEGGDLQTDGGGGRAPEVPGVGGSGGRCEAGPSLVHLNP